MLAVPALLLAACGGGDDATTSGTSAEKLSGSIESDGSSTVGPLTAAVQEEFNKAQSGVQVVNKTSGTGGGFKRFCNGETDISNASRAIKEEEKTACAGKGVAYKEFKVGLDGLAVVTSSKNTFLKCLSFSQMRKIFGVPGVKKWNEVDPSFPAEDVKVFAPGRNSGTFDFFVEHVLGTSGPKPLEANQYTPSEDDNVLVQGIQGTTNSWGFFGYAYYTENADKLKVVEVKKDDAGSCVAPDKDTVLNSSYQISRPLYIYVKEASLQRPEVKEFVRFYLETTPEIIEEVGYVALPKAAYTAALTGLT
jgi:phosphate transport system substrate-binding protein